MIPFPLGKVMLWHQSVKAFYKFVQNWQIVRNSISNSMLIASLPSIIMPGTLLPVSISTVKYAEQNSQNIYPKFTANFWGCWEKLIARIIICPFSISLTPTNGLFIFLKLCKSSKFYSQLFVRCQRQKFFFFFNKIHILKLLCTLYHTLSDFYLKSNQQ